LLLPLKDRRTADVTHCHYVGQTRQPLAGCRQHDFLLFAAIITRKNSADAAVIKIRMTAKFFPYDEVLPIIDCYPHGHEDIS
jgi:hypothetical protein